MSAERGAHVEKPTAMYAAPPSLTSKMPPVKSDSSASDYHQQQQAAAPSTSNGYYSNVTAKGKLILPTALWVLLIIAGLCFLSLLTTLNKTLGTLDTLVELEQANAKLNNNNNNIKHHRRMKPLVERLEDSSADNLFAESSSPAKAASFFSFPSWASLEPQPHHPMGAMNMEQLPGAPPMPLKKYELLIDHLDDNNQNNHHNHNNRPFQPISESVVSISSNNMNGNEMSSVFDQFLEGAGLGKIFANKNSPTKSSKFNNNKEESLPASSSHLLPSITANIDKINVNINADDSDQKKAKFSYDNERQMARNHHHHQHHRQQQQQVESAPFGSLLDKMMSDVMHSQQHHIGGANDAPAIGFPFGPAPGNQPLPFLFIEPVAHPFHHPKPSRRPKGLRHQLHGPPFQPPFELDNHFNFDAPADLPLMFGRQNKNPNPIVITFEGEAPLRKTEHQVPQLDINAVEPSLDMPLTTTTKGPNALKRFDFDSTTEKPQQNTLFTFNAPPPPAGSDLFSNMPFSGASGSEQPSDSILLINNLDNTNAADKTDKERNQVHDLFTTFFGPPPTPAVFGANSKLIPDFPAPQEAKKMNNETTAAAAAPTTGELLAVIPTDKATTTTTTTTTTIIEDTDPKDEKKSTTVQSSSSDETTQKDMNKFADALLDMFALPQFANQLEPIKVDENLQKSAQSAGAAPPTNVSSPASPKETMQCECHKVPAASTNSSSPKPPPAAGGSSGGPPSNSTAGGASGARPTTAGNSTSGTGAGPPAAGGSSPNSSSSSGGSGGANATRGSGGPPQPLGYATTSNRLTPDAFVLTGSGPASQPARAAQSSGASSPRPVPQILAQAEPTSTSTTSAPTTSVTPVTTSETTTSSSSSSSSFTPKVTEQPTKVRVKILEVATTPMPMASRQQASFGPLIDFKKVIGDWSIWPKSITTTSTEQPKQNSTSILTTSGETTQSTQSLLPNTTTVVVKESPTTIQPTVTVLPSDEAQKVASNKTSDMKEQQHEKGFKSLIKKADDFIERSILNFKRLL